MSTWRISKREFTFLDLEDKEEVQQVSGLSAGFGSLEGLEGYQFEAKLIIGLSEIKVSCVMV